MTAVAIHAFSAALKNYYAHRFCAPPTAPPIAKLLTSWQKVLAMERNVNATSCNSITAILAIAVILAVAVILAIATILAVAVILAIVIILAIAVILAITAILAIAVILAIATILAISRLIENRSSSMQHY
jgi:amino acid transporter